MATFTYTNPTVGGSEDTWGETLNSNWTALGAFFGDLDSTELEVLGGITASTAELNLLTGVTASTAELNLLDGVTASTDEINYLSGVTGAIQTQIDNVPQPPALSQVQVEDDTSTVFGQVSGQRLAQAFNAIEQQIGVGQTWQTPVRSVGTNYQNTTEKPILVIVSEHQPTSVNKFFEVSVDGSTWIGVSSATQFNDWKQNHSVIIPIGSYYRLATGIFENWAELR